MSSQGILPGKRGPVRTLYRFAVGRPLDGRRKTDATFLRAGWSPVSEGQYLTRYSYWAGWQVAALRFGSVAACLFACLHPLQVIAIGQSRWTLTAFISVWTVKMRAWRTRRHILYPLSAALRTHLHYGAEVPTRRWLRVPRSLVSVDPLPPVAWLTKHAPEWWDVLEARYADNPIWKWHKANWHQWVADREKVLSPVMSWFRTRAVVSVAVPHSLGSVPTETRQGIESAVSAKLGGEWTAQWKLRGRVARVVFLPRPEPPKRVLYVNFRERMELLNADLYKFAIGLEAGFKTVILDFENESPHLLLSMGSGAGKSVTIRLLAAQLIRKGWAVIVLDFKQDHYWAADMMDEEIPGVVYIRKIADIHTALIKLEKIREWRSEYEFTTRKDATRLDVQPVAIIYEEMNGTFSADRIHWQNTLNGKGKSPAVTAFTSLAQLGRSAHMHLIAVGQYLTADVFGGNGGRENFGLRCLGRYTPAAWRLLVPEYGAPPHKSTIRGRIQVCQDGESPTETQVAILTHEEVREYALAERDTLGVTKSNVLPFSWEIPSGPYVPALSPVPAEGHPALDQHVSSPLSPEGTTAPMYDLQKWIELEVVPWNYQTAKQRRFREQRKKECVLPSERQVYTEAEIRQWVESATRKESVS